MSLEIKSLQKSFWQGDTEIQVLKGVDLSVQAGELVAVVGQSGSGKSTLLSLLAGLDRPSAGDIRIKGTQLNSLDENELTDFRARHIGIIFQQYHLMSHLTALENVELPLEIIKHAGERDLGHTDIRGKAQEILQMMGLGHRLNHFPHQLSGGECQRVAIGRALVVGPSILLADEPSGNLDTATGTQVMEVLFNAVKTLKMTTILVTHSEVLAERCPRQIRLANGRVV